jgi:hypothetical protein
MRRRHRLRVAAVLVVVLGAGAAMFFTVVLPLLQPVGTSGRGTTGSSPHPSPAPGCLSGKLPNPARLGTVAWVADGRLTVLDLGTCRRAVLVASGAGPPVRFSPDGRWLAFGDGRVVPAAGGRVTRPLGSSVQTWEWSPTEVLLAGVTRETGVLLAGPGGRARSLLPAGSGVGHLAFAPDGKRLAVDRLGVGIQVVDAATGRSATVFHQANPGQAPQVAGWSPDGGWVLFWRSRAEKGAVPLDAVPAGGGDWVNVFDPVLPYGDFLSRCGRRVAVTAGPGQVVSAGKQIVLTGSPTWRFRDLTRDYTRSWIWPACSPDGRWVAAVATPNHEESAGLAGARALWLLASDGSSRRRLIAGGETAPELPRWSSDGRVLLVVLRSGTRWSSPGSLFLVQVDRKSGRMLRRVGPVAELGPAEGPGGHQEWAAVTDWHRPG